MQIHNGATTNLIHIVDRILAIFVGRFRMSIDEATEHLGALSAAIFSSPLNGDCFDHETLCEYMKELALKRFGNRDAAFSEVNSSGTSKVFVYPFHIITKTNYFP